MNSQSENRSLREIYTEIDPGKIDKWDHYIDVYDEIFSEIRHKVGSVLEIGVFRGGSLQLWQQYFGENAKVVGLDLDYKALDYAQDGIVVEIGDQADPECLNKILAKHGPFDIVIDDGGHYWHQQITSLSILYDFAKLLYIVEDVHTSFWSRFAGKSEESLLDVAKQKIDLLNEYFVSAGSSEEFYQTSPPMVVSNFRNSTRSIEFFDSLVVFKKGMNPPPVRRPISFDRS